ncbi:MAG: YifB family Mg chelatase-like AAA ATPase [Rhodospirillales bacterium]
MVARIGTIALEGVDVIDVDVQVQTSNGNPRFIIVGLPDKAVGESRERVRAALHAMGLALPPKRITVNMAPADQMKEGSHFDLPIALGLLAAMDVIPADALLDCVALGELALDGRVNPVAGVLPAAIHAQASGKRLICPAEQGSEAAWAGDPDVLAIGDLIQFLNHVRGQQVLTPPRAVVRTDAPRHPDMADIKGQETAKRAVEIAAAGRHNLLMLGPPGSGKSMLAARLPGLLPELTAEEMLEVSMVHSVAGALRGGLVQTRPFRDPHHSASTPALIGGGRRTRPGEVSLAHLGVLFLDELPEFQRGALDALRQPVETGRVSVARVNHHVTYPARFQLIAAMNPCRCGHLDDPALACARAPRCAQDYQAKVSGPVYDRIDLTVEVPAVHPADLSRAPAAEPSAAVAARVAAAHALQAERYQGEKRADGSPVRSNADADGELLERWAAPDAAGRALLDEAATRMKMSARGYHRALRVARTLADLDGAETVGRVHIAEAVAYRRAAPGRTGLAA